MLPGNGGQGCACKALVAFWFQLALLGRVSSSALLASMVYVLPFVCGGHGGFGVSTGCPRDIGWLCFSLFVCGGVKTVSSCATSQKLPNCCNDVVRTNTRQDAPMQV